MFERRKPRKESKSEIIENEEKARVMAEAEDLDREFLSGFKSYIEDPVTYRAEEEQRIAEAKARGMFTRSNADDYMYLYQEGVRSQDLEQVAIAAGEEAAFSYDDEHSYKDMHPATLKVYLTALRWWEKRVSKALDIAHERAESKIDLSADTRGVVVAEKLQRIYDNEDPDVATYEVLHKKYQMIHAAVERGESALRGKMEGIA